MIENTKNKIISKIIFNTLLAVITVICVIPFIVVLSVSFSDESTLISRGYGIFPRGFSLGAYKIAFANNKQILSSYALTIITTAIGATLATLVTTLAAYPLSRRTYALKKYFNLYFYFTMIFSGGAVAEYIWISQGLGLRNNVLVLILPMLSSAWYIFLMRTYMSQIPLELIEAAKIDGAGEYYTLFKIVLPVNSVATATIFVMFALNYWNQWYSCLMYLDDDRYITLQYYLMRLMNNIDAIMNSQNTQAASINISKLPSETTRMALCVISAGPMIFLFSFFQKYFVGGITVGSVKG